VLRSDEVRVAAVPDERFSGIFYGRCAANVDRFRWAADITHREAPARPSSAKCSDPFGRM
jgi:hypothetical protein